jgi:hypothetical protein
MSKAKQAHSDFNLTTLTSRQTEDVVRAAIESGSNIYLMARRGSGKTIIMKEVIKSMKCKEIYLNASTLERTDCSGFPKIMDSKDKDFISFLLPEYFKYLIQGDVPCVLLLDEVDKASSDIFASLLELTQFHTVNGRALPNLKCVLMTGNFQAEGGARPALPLLDRAEKYIMNTTTTQWLDWAARSGKIHPSVTAFISDHPDELMGEVEAGELYGDASPRGWENTSKILNFGEEKKWPVDLLITKVAGCVGRSASLKFDSYFKHYQVLLPEIEKIMKGQESKAFEAFEPGKKIVCCMIICSRLSRALDEMLEKNEKKKELPAITKVVARFLKNVDPEMTLIAVRSQIGLQRTVQAGLDEVPEWEDIINDISNKLNIA